MRSSLTNSVNGLRSRNCCSSEKSGFLMSGFLMRVLKPQPSCSSLAPHRPQIRMSPKPAMRLLNSIINSCLQSA
mgnify:CR=1 FL=1